MVRYFFENIKFSFDGRRQNNLWLKTVASDEGRRLGDVNIIFCSDDYILDINRKFLGHDYFTDIITFDYCNGNLLSGDLFVSVDSVRENSVFYGVDFGNELNRVMVHGLLHLIGYDDHTVNEKKVMRGKEDYYLDRRSELFGSGKTI